jgi:hypothetical protein
MRYYTSPQHSKSKQETQHLLFTLLALFFAVVLYPSSSSSKLSTFNICNRLCAPRPSIS